MKAKDRHSGIAGAQGLASGEAADATLAPPSVHSMLARCVAPSCGIMQGVGA
jgi:hypothetical protein